MHRFIKFTFSLMGIMLCLHFFNNSAIAEDIPTQLLQEKSKSVLNAIHSNDVRIIMRRLNVLAYEREFTELELEKLRARQIKLLAQTAGELAQTAEQLPEDVQKDLNREDQTTFRAMANQLYSESLRLEKEAEANNYRALNEGYQRLRETCNACHRLFREK